MSDEELLLFNDIYNQTQHFGRTQFVREIMKLQQENQELKEKNETIQEKFKEWKKDIEKERKFYLCERDCAFRLKESKKYLSYTRQIEQLLQENQKLKDRINKSIKYMKNNATSNYFDKEKNMFRREEDLLKILNEEE